MDKRKIIILIIIFIIIASLSSFIYLNYITDYTYEDNKISITIPAQTKFNILGSENDYWTFVKYNSTDENNITVNLMKLKNPDIDDPTIQSDLFKTYKSEIIKDLTINKKYEVVSVAENYTIYHNKENNTYTSLIFFDNMCVVVMITCNNSIELIDTISDSFVLKAFNTLGLTLKKVDNNIPVKNVNDAPVTSSSNEKTNSNVKVINGVIYTLEDGIMYELHPGEPGYDEEILKYT